MIDAEKTKNYEEQDWLEEWSKATYRIQMPNGQMAELGLGTSNLTCPRCKTIGFYGPRIDPPIWPASMPINRKYRACKFCGLWQDVPGYPGTRKEGKIFDCLPIRCSGCKTFQWTEYNSNKPCEKKCGGVCKEDKWPTDNLGHEFHKTKAEIYKLLKLVSSSKL